jgi:hypothetical protein
MTSVASTAATLALLVFLGAGSAFGQSAHDQHHPQQGPATQGMPMQPGMMGGGMGPGMTGQGMIGPGMMGQGMAPGMMGQTPGAMGQGGMWHIGPHMMSPAEMQQMMAHMGGMMGQGGHGMGPGGMAPDMHHGMMGPMPGMMGQTGPDMLGPGMMGPGMTGMHQGFRVVPMMHLTTDDVRQFLQRHISAHGLIHLQVGEVTETDDETITADIVTREGSLALRLEIDAYTGFVKSVS